MKNIHVLPTDKPSRLFLNVINNKLLIDDDNTLKKVLPSGSYQNIYITSNEEIKEGDWHFNLALNLVEKTTSFHNGLLCEKIILTTDQDLIKDGVQAIDDGFLVWFVDNPNSKVVKIEKEQVNNKPGSSYSTITNYKYKIIIPQEEPKQEYEYVGECNGNNDNGCFLDSCGHDCGCFTIQKKSYIEKGEEIEISRQEFNFQNKKNKIMETPKTFKELFANTGIEPTTDESGNTHYNFKATMKEEPKQEATLEEVAENYGWRIKTNTFSDPVKANELANSAKQDFINGAKWQQERSYSEEEVIDLLYKRSIYQDHFESDAEVREWFNKFKKK